MSEATGGSVFEAADVTSGENYWTLGVWPTLDAALSDLCAVNDPAKLGSDYGEHEGSCVVEIRERALGFGGIGKVVAEVSWQEDYDEEADEYRWALISVINYTDRRPH